MPIPVLTLLAMFRFDRDATVKGFLLSCELAAEEAEPLRWRGWDRVGGETDASKLAMNNFALPLGVEVLLTLLSLPFPGDFVAAAGEELGTSAVRLARRVRCKLRGVPLTLLFLPFSRDFELVARGE
jgi:hypothetical protein